MSVVICAVYLFRVFKRYLLILKQVKIRRISTGCGSQNSLNAFSKGTLSVTVVRTIKKSESISQG